MICLISNDGEEFIVARDVIMLSKTISLMLEEHSSSPSLSNDNHDEQRIPLLNVESKTLSKILEYCQYYVGEDFPDFFVSNGLTSKISLFSFFLTSSFLFYYARYQNHINFVIFPKY